MSILEYNAPVGCVCPNYGKEFRVYLDTRADFIEYEGALP
jgi:hypothetical protein